MSGSQGGALPRIRVALFAAVACAALSTPAVSRADTVTIGQVAPLGTAPAVCGTCTNFQMTNAAGSPSYAVPPGQWTVTSWAMTASPGSPAVAKLRLFRFTGGGGEVQIVAESSEQTALANTVGTFAASIPVQPGDLIGLRTGTGASMPLSRPGASGDVVAQVFGDPVLGQTLTPGFAPGQYSVTGPASLLNVAATLEGSPPPQEPPAEGDGQPPQTTITDVPRKRRNRHSFFSFSSSEPGSSFRCSLDDAAFESCVSPKDYRNLKRGPHTFRVFAIDAAGNADPTPAEHEWRVRGRKKK